MQRLEVSGAVRPIYGSLGFKRLTPSFINYALQMEKPLLCTISVILFLAWFIYVCSAHSLKRYS